MEVALNEPAAVRIIGNLMGNYINAKAVIRGTITKVSIFVEIQLLNCTYSYTSSARRLNQMVKKEQ